MSHPKCEMILSHNPLGVVVNTNPKINCCTCLIASGVPTVGTGERVYIVNI